jgi:hypothetical protein
MGTVYHFETSRLHFLKRSNVEVMINQLPAPQSATGAEASRYVTTVRLPTDVPLCGELHSRGAQKRCAVCHVFHPAA